MRLSVVLARSTTGQEKTVYRGTLYGKNAYNTLRAGTTTAVGDVIILVLICGAVIPSKTFHCEYVTPIYSNDAAAHTLYF